jgi:hypothetical protein
MTCLSLSPLPNSAPFVRPTPTQLGNFPSTPYFNKPNLTSFESLSTTLNVDNPLDWLNRLANRVELEIQNDKLQQGELILRKRKKKEREGHTRWLARVADAVTKIRQEIQAEAEIEENGE